LVERDLTTSHGMITVATASPVRTTGTDVVVDFTGVLRPRLAVCGRHFEAATPSGLASSMRTGSAAAVVGLPLEAHVEGSTLVLRQPAELFGPGAGAYLSGVAALDAAAKAATLAPVAPGSWLPEIEFGEVEHKLLDALVAEDRWDGPLVVSMPRTGSTLLGMLFLLLRDPPGTGTWRFDRYIHEPAAPLFWQGRLVDSIDEIITDPLTPRDVIQESAYQFSAKPLARWFLRQARSPVVFAVRHPQISWPSRWRIMLRMRLEKHPDDPDRDRIAAALESEDFSELGDILTAVTPADNGWLATLSLIQCCLEEGIDFVVIDNARFRTHPESILAQVCGRLGLPFDPHLTDWSDLSEIRDRVVMGELARGEEYEHYYRRTIDSSSGIIRRDRPLLDARRFPPELRGAGEGPVTVEEAVTWYHMLIARDEALRV
jgi:hypothetical protein